MPWVELVVAGLLEVVWSVGMKYTAGFTRPWPTAAVVVAIAASMTLLARATRTIPLGTAYAVWVGIGTLGAVALGILLFDEPRSPARLGFLALLAIAILGLKLTAQSG